MAPYRESVSRLSLPSPERNLRASSSSHSRRVCREGTMFLYGPESLSRLHLSILEIEGIAFNILLFLKFVVHEIGELIRNIRKLISETLRILHRAVP